MAAVAPPRRLRLLGDVDGAALADHGDPDLARVVELVLDVPGDLAGQQRRGVVVDLGRLDHHAHLVARLHGEAFLHALLALGDALQRLEPLDVVLERLAAGAGPRRGDGVGGLHKDGLDSLRLDVLVVRLDGVAHALRLAVLLAELLRDVGVRTVDLVVDGLADVVQQAGALGDLDVGAQLGGHDAGEMGYLDGVVEHVLAVAGAVLEAPEDSDEFGRHAVHVRVEAGLFPRFLHGGLDLGLRLKVHLLDARRVDTPVGDELGEREARGLAAHAVEARQHHGLGRVVDDEVDARGVLEGADVAPLAADDAALHVVGRQVDHRHGGLGDVVGGGALDGQREDVAGAAVGFAARLFLDLADQLGNLVARLVLRLLEQHVLGLRRAEPGDALELDHGLVVGDLQLVGDALGLGVAVAQRLLATVLLRGARVDLLVALQQALLGLAYLFAPAAQLGLDLAAHLVHFLFRLEPSFLDDGLGLTLGVAQQLLGFALRPGQLARSEIAADQVPRDHAHCQPHQPHHDVHGNHHLSPIPSQVARHEKGRATRPASATLARARDTVL